MKIKLKRSFQNKLDSLEQDYVMKLNQLEKELK